jgi:2-methylisocitrate lyase-like PEP mutase family enzyme
MENATPIERYGEFRRLHQSGCFVIPNAWDAGSARALQRLGFKAIATTSSGFAWSRGKPDNHVPLPEVLQHFRDIARSVALPVSGDFEACFAKEPEGVHRNVVAALETGICGVSIEDATRESGSPLFELDLAIERVRAARTAVEDYGRPVVLTARFEGFLVGVADLDQAVKRLCAYAEAGADCLYAPGIRTAEQITAIVRAVAPKPVNVLVGADFSSVELLAALGVRRISVGGALARSAWTAFLRAAKEIAEHGTFRGFSGIVQTGEMNGLMGEAPDVE